MPCIHNVRMYIETYLISVSQYNLAFLFHILNHVKKNMHSLLTVHNKFSNKKMGFWILFPREALVLTVVIEYVHSLQQSKIHMCKIYVNLFRHTEE